MLKTNNIDTSLIMPDEKSLLELAFCLQSTLDIQNILQLFVNYLTKKISVEHVGYMMPEKKVAFSQGEETQYYFHQDLYHNDKNLGQLVLGSNNIFTEDDRNTIKNSLVALLYPINNAINYLNAVEASLLDPLTCVGNKKAFNTTLHNELSLSQRHEHPLSMLALDLDNFKLINDTYGHATGDSILILFTQNIKNCVRKTDQIFRIGGEEFIVLLRNTNKQGAQKLAERIKNTIATEKINDNDNIIAITTSIGVASATLNDTEKSFYMRADKALYQAKAEGRNCIAS